MCGLQKWCIVALSSLHSGCCRSGTTSNGSLVCAATAIFMHIGLASCLPLQVLHIAFAIHPGTPCIAACIRLCLVKRHTIPGIVTRWSTDGHVLATETWRLHLPPAAMVMCGPGCSPESPLRLMLAGSVLLQSGVFSAYVWVETKFAAPGWSCLKPTALCRDKSVYLRYCMQQNVPA